ncbi:MAG: TonB-dependent receptor [Dialister sp.]|nr:TonB-dependent receptor [Dialister sp.]
MKKDVLKAGVLGMLVVGVPCMGGVDAAEMPVYSLDEVVVTATRTMKEIQEVPSGISVITAKDMEKKNIHTVRDAIGQMPGLYINRKGDSSEISLRGFDTTDILVLVDGVQMNSTYNSTVNLNDIPVDNIERVEVLRGAASSIYGGHAVGGVVNITTKEAKEEGTTATANLSYGSHDTWKKSIYLHSKANEKWSFGMGYEERKSDGFRGFYRTARKDKKLAGKTADYTADLPVLSNKSYVYGGRGEKAWKYEGYNAYIKYDISDTQSLKYSYAHTESNYHYNNPFSYVKDANGNMVFSGIVKTQKGDFLELIPKNFYGYRGEGVKEKHILSFKDTANKLESSLSYSRDKYNGFTSATLPKNYTKADWEGAGDYSSHPEKIYNFNLEKAWEKVGDNHTIVAGLNLKQEEMDQDRFSLSRWKDKDSKTEYYAHDKGKVKNMALYVQDEWKVSDPATVYLGVRYDRFQKGDGHFWLDKEYDYSSKGKTYNEISPKVAFSYQADENTNYYVSYGHSFNPPPLYNIYRYGGSGMGNVIPNPGLNPEKSDTYEIGVKKKLSPKTNMSLNAYQVKTKDKIAYTYFYDYKDELNKKTGKMEKKRYTHHKQYINYGEEKRRGVEIELTHSFNENLSGYMNWAWQIGKLSGPAIPDTNKDKAYSGRVNYGIPKHIFHAGLDWKKDKLNLLLDCEYVSARMAPGEATDEFGAEDQYFLVNTAVNYDLTKDCTLQLAVNNLLDRTYYCNEATDGRTYTFSVQYRM